MEVEKKSKFSYPELILLLLEYLYERFQRLIRGAVPLDEEYVEGKVVLVTGANSGLGKVTALEFAKRGCTVIMACRNAEQGQKALDEIKAKTNSENLVSHFHHGYLLKVDIRELYTVIFGSEFKFFLPEQLLRELDLADLSSVRTFAEKIKQEFPAIHILVNNAGVYFDSDELQHTKDGFEVHMGINHLGHFLLTNLLLDNIKRAAPSR